GPGGVRWAQVARSLGDLMSWRTVTEFRDHIYLGDVRRRAMDQDRRDLASIRDLKLRLPNGNTSPLAQIASFSYGLEEPVVWRRERLPTISVEVDFVRGFRVGSVNPRLASAVGEIRASRSPGYLFELA